MKKKEETSDASNKISEFRNTILNRIKNRIEEYYDSQGIKYECKNGPQDAIMGYFSWLYRQVIPLKRTVTYSKELQKKIDTGALDTDNANILAMFKKCFEDGKDMRGFLSTLTLDAEKGDYLRYVWHLYHLHMSKMVAATEQEMRKNRSGYQLLAIITKDEVLFVDVIQHPARGKSYEYFNLDHLRIIRDNGWFEKIGCLEIPGMIPGTLKPEITDSEEIYNLYKANVNISFRFDGKGYSFLGGIVVSGQPMVAVDTYKKIVDNIYKIFREGDVCNFVSFVGDINNQLVLLIRVVSSNGEKRYYDLLRLEELDVGDSFKTILVAGGAGFIGSHLCDALLNLGHTVICADKLIMGDKNIKHLINNPSFMFVNAELADQEAVDSIFKSAEEKGEPIDCVYHLAANSDIQKGSREPGIDFNDTLLTTRTVLEGMRTHRVHNLFFASTSAIYGEKVDEILTEITGDLRPVSYYGGCKLASEALISSYVSMADLNSVIFRFPNVIGPRLTHGVIYDFIRKLQNNPAELEILGDGTQCKPYIYVLDLVEAIMDLTQPFLCDQSGVGEGKEQKSGGTEEIYNLSTNSPGTTVTTIADIIIEKMGLNDVHYVYTGGDRGWKGDVPRFEYDISKVLSTGWKPKHTSDEAVRQSVGDALGK